MELEIVRANPAGNITILTLTPLENREQRTAAANALLANPDLQAEQAGFVLPRSPGQLPRLEMMGGEFCGNAARSFGLFIAKERGLQGRGELDVSISGAGKPLRTRFDLDAGTASAEIPFPQDRRELRFQDRPLTVYTFEGISHVIVPEQAPGPELFSAIRARFEEDCGRLNLPLPDALGVMFWEPASAMMSPAVYVYGTASLVFESSCGSGSAALGLSLAEGFQDGTHTYAIAQRGGLIETTVEKHAGTLRRLSIGGPVTLSGRMRVRCETAAQS